MKKRKFGDRALVDNPVLILGIFVGILYLFLWIGLKVEVDEFHTVEAVISETQDGSGLKVQSKAEAAEGIHKVFLYTENNNKREHVDEYILQEGKIVFEIDPHNRKFIRENEKIFIEYYAGKIPLIKRILKSLN